MIHGELTIPLVLCCSLVDTVGLEVVSWLCWGCQAIHYLGLGVVRDGVVDRCGWHWWKLGCVGGGVQGCLVVVYLWASLGVDMVLLEDSVGPL